MADKLLFTRPYHFKTDKQTVVMQHVGGKFLRVKPKETDEVNSEGGTGRFARWEADLSEDGYVMLKNTHTDKYLRILDDGKKVDVGGKGGRFCPFKIHHEKETGLVRLESKEFEGKFVAVQDGVVRVGTGGRFCPLQFFRNTPEGDFSLPYYFKTDKKVVVLLHVEGKHLRVKPKATDEADTAGGTGAFATWEADLDGEYVRLKSTKTDKYLRIVDDKVDANGKGGRFCPFKVHHDEHQVGRVRLESKEHPGKFIAVRGGEVVTGTGGPYTFIRVYRKD